MENSPAPKALTILLVEDEPVLRMLLVETFSEEEFDVLTAPNADAALGLCGANPDIDVMLTDVRMPGSMDGIELARSVQEARPEIAVIITSAYFWGDVRIPEGVHFVPKPYGIAHLIHLARSLASSPAS